MIRLKLGVIGFGLRDIVSLSSATEGVLLLDEEGISAEEFMFKGSNS